MKSTSTTGELGFYSTSSSSVVESVNVAREWQNAQAIPLSVTPDIVIAARLELEFLGEISLALSLLQSGPIVDRAILRYSSKGGMDGRGQPSRWFYDRTCHLLC